VQCETTETSLRGNELLRATANKMWSSGGIRAYYRGLTLGLFGIVPYSAIDLGCFEGMKRAYQRGRVRRTGCSERDAQPGSAPWEVGNGRERGGVVYGGD
jgi:solute carrier family 25 (mitochondrial phosphate transporter), member 23/24/25/41